MREIKYCKEITVTWVMIWVQTWEKNQERWQCSTVLCASSLNLTELQESRHQRMWVSCTDMQQKNLPLKETTSILNHLPSLSVWITSSSPICIFIPDKLYLASPLDQQPWLSLYLGGPCSPFFSLAGKTADTKPGAAHTCWGLQQQSCPCSQEA